MALVDREHAALGITLTPTQADVARSVIETLRGPGDPQKLVIINGLSGVGKSAVLNNITGSLPQYDAITVTPSDIKYSEPPIKGKHNLVTTTTLGAFDETAEYISKKAIETIPGISVQVLDLPGMNKKEILAYITRLKCSSALSSEQIAQYSMGVPLLAERLVTQGIDAHTASHLAAKYFKESFHQIAKRSQLVSAARPFLQMPIPADVQNRFIEVASVFRPTYIYEELLRTMEKRERLAQRGIVEDNPLFLAPESEAIYNQMFKNSEQDAQSWIDIFAPEVPVATFAKFQQAFGSKGGAYLQVAPSRVDMFSATERKLSLWGRDEHGQEITHEGEYAQIVPMAHALTEAFKNRELPIVPTGLPDARSFYVHAHDHPGMVSNPAQIGWLTESLLQQNGVPYFVLNKTYGTNYIYDPAHRHVVMAPEKVDLNKYLYSGLSR